MIELIGTMVLSSLYWGAFDIVFGDAYPYRKIVCGMLLAGIVSKLI